jgi:hypothetical protein
MRIQRIGMLAAAAAALALFLFPIINQGVKTKV